MKSLAEFATQLEVALKAVTPALEIGLDKVGTLAETLAHHYPGTYQEGWKPLAPTTLEDKAARGYPVPSPLYREGDMAASYDKHLDLAELAVVVGSEELKALWHELGTTKMPARPVLSLAMSHSLPYAADVFGEIAVTMLTGKALIK